MNKLVEKKIDLVANRLIHLESNQELNNKFVNMSQQEAERKGFFSRDFGMDQWDWPQGVGIFGLKRYNEKFDKYIIDWALSEMKKGLPKKNINTLCPLQTLMDFKEFEGISLEWMKWIEDEAPRTQENGLEHTTTGNDKNLIKLNEEQIWIDTIFMTVIFVAKMGVKYNNVKWRQEATYQILLHTKYLLDTKSGLFYHGWNFKNQSNYGGNFWCRGNSWFTMGIPLFLEAMDGFLESDLYEYFVNLYKNQVIKLIDLRNKDSLWHTILDDSNAYTETSGSAGIITGIYLGLELGILEKIKYEKICQEAIAAILDRVDEIGVVHGVSAGTAISSSKWDYKEIIQCPMAYGQAMVICALSEHMNYSRSH